MQYAFWDDESLSGAEPNGASFQVDSQLAFDYIKEFIIVVVLVPMVLALHHSEPNHRVIHAA